MGGAKGRGGRRGQPRKPLGTGFACGCDLQGQGCEIRFQDFRHPPFRHPGFGSRRPKPPATSGGYPAGASGALRHHVPADPHGLQMFECCAGIEDRFPAQAGIHHDPNAFDGQGSFGDGGGKHHFPLTRRTRSDCPALRFHREQAEKRTYPCMRIQLAQSFGTPADLAFTGKKDQHIPFPLLECRPDKADDRGNNLFDEDIAPIMDLDREPLSRTRNTRRLQSRTKGFHIDGRRHDHQFQIRT